MLRRLLAPAIMTAAIAALGAAPGAQPTAEALADPGQRLQKPQAAGTSALSARRGAAGLPQGIYAPYFQTYYPGSPAAQARAAGVKYLSLGFIISTGRSSCTIAWNGDRSTPISYAHYGADISALRHRGGDAIASFGGDAPAGRDIAESCHSVSGVAAAYQKVITTYGIKRIDLDVEGTALSDRATVDRRNKAIARTTAWAAATGRTVEFTYTLPAYWTGMNHHGVALMKNAAANRAPIRAVNLMTGDYYDGMIHEMARDSIRGAQGAFTQLRTVYPQKTDAQLWAMIELCEMLGVDDKGKEETFTLADARTVTRWASRQHLAGLTSWALGRDNGNCPGIDYDDDTCSGIAQGRYAFAHEFQQLMTGTRTALRS